MQPRDSSIPRPLEIGENKVCPNETLLPNSQKKLLGLKIKENELLPDACFVENDSIERVKKDFKDCFDETIKTEPMVGPDMDIHLRTDCPIIPTRVNYAIRTPLHLKKSADQYMETLIQKKVIERVPASEGPSEWLLSGFFVKKNAYSPDA